MSALPQRQLALESCEFHSKTIFWMELYVKISFISIFSFSFFGF